MIESTLAMTVARKVYERYGLARAVLVGLAVYVGVKYAKRRFLADEDDEEPEDT